MAELELSVVVDWLEDVGKIAGDGDGSVLGRVRGVVE